MIGPGVSGRLTLILVAALGSVAALSSFDTMAIEQAAGTTVKGSLEETLAWARLIGGIVGTIGGIIGMVGIYAYYKTTIRTKTTQALEATVDIYEKQIEALTTRDVTRDRDLKETVALMADREKEVAALRARTDLSEVLKAVQLLAQAQTHSITDAGSRDQMVMDTLSSFMKTSVDRYSAGMKVMTGLLEQSSKNLEGALEQSRQNNTAIVSLVESVRLLSKRFGDVERQVDAVADSVESGIEQTGSKPAGRRADSADERRSRDRSGG